MIEIFNNSGENSLGKLRSETHKIYGLNFDSTDLSSADSLSSQKPQQCDRSTSTNRNALKTPATSYEQRQYHKGTTSFQHLKYVQHFVGCATLTTFLKSLQHFQSPQRLFISPFF